MTKQFTAQEFEWMAQEALRQHMEPHVNSTDPLTAEKEFAALTQAAAQSRVIEKLLVYIERRRMAGHDTARGAEAWEIKDGLQALLREEGLTT